MKKKAHSFLSSLREKAPASEAPSPRSAGVSVVASLDSVAGISKAAAQLAAMYLLYKAVPPVVDFFRGVKEDHDHAEEEAAKARHDLVETKLRQDKKDTAVIHKQIREEWAERERRKLPPRPKAVRGRWEGNVFVPSAEQPRDKK
jgi:hypothetical protein